MFEDRDSMRRSPIQMYWSATVSIIALNVLVFLVQLYYGGPDTDSKFNQLFALSLDGLKAGHIWQLLSYQFMHGSWLHLFVNSWAIFVFGRAIESVLGKQRMVLMYFLSGVAGGILQSVWTLLLPAEYNVPVVGASAGAMGLIAAFAVLFPNQRLFLLLFFVIPLKLKARTLLWLSVAFAIVGLVLILMKSRFMDNVAHAGHLGGIIGGYVFARMLVRRYGPPHIIEQPNPSLKITPVSE